MRRSKGLQFYKRRKKISAGLIREIISWFILVAISAFVAVVVVYFFGMRISVIGVSMEPGLSNGQEVLINRFWYNLVGPSRDDVIVFLPNGNINTHYYVKRVVGIPGDTIQIKDSKLYVNGIRMDDDTYDDIADSGIAANEIVIQKDEYFVLGDNRNNSEDSRSGNIGPVSKDSIIGKAWFHMAAGNNGIGFVS